MVEKKDRGIVHHMVLYSCQHDFDEKHLNVTGECYHPNMPRSVQECAGNSAVFAWAVGGVVRIFHIVFISSPYGVDFHALCQPDHWKQYEKDLK